VSKLEAGAGIELPDQEWLVRIIPAASLKNAAVFTAPALGILNDLFFRRVINAGPVTNFLRRAIAALTDIVFIQHADINTG
jgi:hypothetical protein